MQTQTSTPQTLVEAIRYFSDPDVCLNFVVKLRWSDGVVCPHCGSKEQHYFLKTRRIWKCKSCAKQFSVKVGTIFEDSALGLDKWLVAIWLIANAKNGISSYEVSRALDVTQKSAWHMMHRIRLAMQTGSFKKQSGEVEVDETYIGGKARNMHKGVRKAKGRGTAGKTIVMGLLERHSEVGHSTVKTDIVPNITRPTMQAKVREHVESGSEVFTDALSSYEGLNPDFVHQVIDHAEAYVNGNVHTNGLENFWSLTKRCIKGTYVSIAPFHLFRYLDEETFRFNNRKGNDGDRFIKVVQTVAGKRLTYKRLTGKVLS
jgi:transposase-like protein